MTEQLPQHGVSHLPVDVTDGELCAWVNEIGDGHFLPLHMFAEKDVVVHIPLVVEYLTEVLNGSLSLFLTEDDGVLSDFAKQTGSPVGCIDTTEAVDFERNLCTKPLAVGCLVDVVVQHQVLGRFPVGRYDLRFLQEEFVVIHETIHRAG